MRTFFAKKAVKAVLIALLCAAPFLTVWVLHEARANVNLMYSSLAGFMPRILVQERQLIDAFGTPTNIAPEVQGNTRYVFDNPPRFVSVLVGADNRIAEIFVAYSNDSAEQMYQTGKGIGVQSTMNDVLAAYGDRCMRKFERGFMGSGDATILTYRDRELRVALEFTFHQNFPYSDNEEQRLMAIRFYREM